jgi:fucose 4-O-acetylase-like acetyltransferase
VWGARTLYVYLLHGPIVWTLRETGGAEWIGTFGVPGVFALIAFGIALTLVLSMAWVSRVCRPVIEPRLEWLFSREVRR